MSLSSPAYLRLCGLGAGLEKSQINLRGPPAQLRFDANDNVEKLSPRGHAYDIFSVSTYCLSIMKHAMLM